MKRDIKLYNVLFPVWILMTIPLTWLVVIPGNFLFDSLVLLIVMLCMKMEKKWEFYKQHIGKVFFFGFLADILASVPMWIMMLLELGGNMGDGPLITVPGLVLAGALIYVFDYHISFKNCESALRKNWH